MRSTWIRATEMILLLPATLYLAPLASFSAVGLLLAMAQDVHFGLAAEWILLKLLIAFVAGVVGIASLWTAMLVSSRVFDRRPVFRTTILLGLLAGLADAVYWLCTIARQPGTHQGALSTWAVWVLILAGPVFVGIEYVLRLTLPTRNGEQQLIPLH